MKKEIKIKLQNLYKVTSKSSEYYDYICRILFVTDDDQFCIIVKSDEEKKMHIDVVPKYFIGKCCKVIGKIKYNVDDLFDYSKDDIKLNINSMYLVSDFNNVYYNSILRINKINENTNEIQCLVSFNNNNTIDDYITFDKSFIINNCIYLGEAEQKLDNIFKY